MNQEDLFQAIGSVDDSVLHKAERKNHYHWKQLAAVAACFLILISGILHFLPAKSSNEHKIYPGSIPWITDDPVQTISRQNGIGMIMYYASWEFRFCWQISVEVQVKEVLPDIYVRPNGSTKAAQYRILLLEVKETIAGQNVPSEIYYMLPASMCSDLGRYDTLIMAMELYEIEDCVMINATQKRVESFQWLFYSGSYGPDWGGVLAFTDGKLDTSLWELEGWGENPYGYKTCFSNDNYPAKENSSVKQVKKAIRDILHEHRDDDWCMANELKVQRKKDIYLSPEEQEVVAYMEGKTFRQLWVNTRHDNDGWYKRIINGLPTNECIFLSAKKYPVKYSDARFTDADLQNLPPLVELLTNAPTMQPPAGNEGKDCRYSGASGEYYKSGDEVFGILRVYWRCDTKTVERVILIRQDGTQIETTDEEVMDLIASYAS